MKNIIVGTSGHVDHGKTCLIKALTGTDCDRLKEEKKRGITIENGFADFTYKDYNISIIDVPGHEKFIRNMLMGIGGIDLVLLIISLDEGVMPQTIEHFRILTMLNINRGIIVFTKCDMVDDETWIEMVKDDARDLVKGSFLENAKEISVSSFTGVNIDKLKDLIIESLDDIKLKNDNEKFFRLPIDRVFTIDGFGTVVTGTLIEGKVKTGDEVMIYPTGTRCKVRNVQVHNDKVDYASAGQRTALNLVNVKKEDIARGAVLGSPDSLIPTKRLDVKINIFKDSEKSILNESKVHIYTGASESVCKVILLDRDILNGGESTYATLILDDEIVVRRNDRFVIRFLSPLITIGGGKILEENPKRHKRNNDEVIESLRIKDEGAYLEVLAELIKERPYDLKELSLKLRDDDLLLNLDKIKDQVIVLGNDMVIHMDYYRRISDISKEILKKYHSENSMSMGLSKEEFKSKLMLLSHIEDKKLLDELISNLTKSHIVIDSNLVRLKDFKVNVSDELRSRLIKKYYDKGFEMPTLDEVLRDEDDKKNARHVLELLCKEGELIKLNQEYCILKEFYLKSLNIVKEETEKEGLMTLARFRDLIGTSRKYAMPILEYMDEKKITKMMGEGRVWNLNN